VPRSIKTKRLGGRDRLVRAFSISFDHFRIWYKITYERGRVLATEGNAWRFFDAPAYFEEPARFYNGDGSAPRAVARPVGRIPGAEVVRFTFPSLHPLRFPETNLAVGRFYRSLRDPDAPVVLISHGWAHRTLKTIEHLYVRPFLRAGFSVAFVAHPLHLERTPRGTYSGELIMSADVVLTVEAFRQGVIDMIAVANWLRAAGHDRIGLFGYSLGGYLAGLMAAVRGDWAFAVLCATGDSPISPILDTQLGRNIREDLAACGMLDRGKITRSWRIISPGAFSPKLPKERILLVAGRYDRIMLPASVRRLWNSWKRPRLVWMNRSHYTLLATNGALMSRAIPFMRTWSGRRHLAAGGRVAAPRNTRRVS
jgi:pimeloyl-ACP methyl ester carboxylesterase